MSIPVVSASWMLSARARVCRPSDVYRNAGGDEHDHREPDHGHDQLGPPDPQLTELNAGRGVGAGRPVLRAGDESDRVAHEEREPEREEEQLQFADSLRRTGRQSADLERQAEDRGGDDAEDDRQPRAAP